MGFRCSLYCVPKTVAEKWKNITEEEYSKNIDSIFDELEKEEIKYDTLTDIICSDYEDKFSSKYFANKLDIESDMYFGTISREQLINIIEEVRTNHIIKWFDGRRIDRNGKLGESFTNPTALYMMKEWTAEDAMKANQGEWNIKADKWKYKWYSKEDKSCHYLTIDLNNKWLVSGGNTYEYLIFDLIHILKIFDWENDVLMVIGG